MTTAADIIISSYGPVSQHLYSHINHLHQQSNKKKIKWAINTQKYHKFLSIYYDVIFPKVLCRNEHARRKEGEDFLTFHGCHKWIMCDIFFFFKEKRRNFRVNSSYTCTLWHIILIPYVVYFCISVYMTLHTYIGICLPTILQSSYINFVTFWILFKAFTFHVMSLDFGRCKEIDLLID